MSMIVVLVSVPNLWQHGPDTKIAKCLQTYQPPSRVNIFIVISNIETRGMRYANICVQIKVI